MHRDSRSERCQCEQREEEYRHTVCHAMRKRLREHIWQCEEYEVRSCIWLHAHRECRGEYHQARHDSHATVYGCYLSRGAQQVYLLVKICRVCTQARRTEADGEEGLPQSLKHHLAGNL